jgi:hypothetical protein
LQRQRRFTEALAVFRKPIDLHLSEASPYDAACAAALAACDLSKDGATLDPEERARLRGQALAWLRAELTGWRRVLEQEPDKSRRVVQALEHWLRDADFNGVRGAAAVDKLPEAERREWRKLWQDVEELRQRAAEAQKSLNSK